MARLIVFNQISLDGYIADKNGDMSWAKPAKDDAEWSNFVAENASGGGTLLLGRVTYDLMRSYWPTPQAIAAQPALAARMNNFPKVVFSRTLDQPSWSHTTLVKTDIAAAVRQLKKESAEGLVILGSASIVSQLADERLIDEYQMVVIPIALGAGKTMFDGLTARQPLKFIAARTFHNGNVYLRYEPARSGE